LKITKNHRGPLVWDPCHRPLFLVAYPFHYIS